MNNNTDITSALRSMAIDNIEQIVGDTPVSVQLNEALIRMASKDHVHDNYAPKEELEALKKIVENLIELIGDESVAVQINNALRREE